MCSQAAVVIIDILDNEYHVTAWYSLCKSAKTKLTLFLNSVLRATEWLVTSSLWVTHCRPHCLVKISMYYRRVIKDLFSKSDEILDYLSCWRRPRLIWKKPTWFLESSSRWKATGSKQSLTSPSPYPGNTQVIVDILNALSSFMMLCHRLCICFGISFEIMLCRRFQDLVCTICLI